VEVPGIEPGSATLLQTPSSTSLESVYRQDPRLDDFTLLSRAVEPSPHPSPGTTFLDDPPLTTGVTTLFGTFCF